MREVRKMERCVKREGGREEDGRAGERDGGRLA